MSDITRRIHGHLNAFRRSTRKSCEEAVIYLGRKEFYDLLITMHDSRAVYIDYPNEVRRVTFHGLEVIEVCMPQYLRVA